MISKELLSEVLGRNVSKVSIPVIENSIHMEFDDVFSTFINIYELAHKCKEWAISQGYTIRVLHEMYNRSPLAHRISVSIISYDGVMLYKVRDLPEPEAIFKACEWIMKQKEE